MKHVVSPPNFGTPTILRMYFQQPERRNGAREQVGERVEFISEVLDSAEMGGGGIENGGGRQKN